MLIIRTCIRNSVGIILFLSDYYNEQGTFPPSCLSPAHPSALDQGSRTRGFRRLRERAVLRRRRRFFSFPDSPLSLTPFSDTLLHQPVPPPALHDHDSDIGRSDSQDEYVQHRPPLPGKATKKKIKRSRPNVADPHPRATKKRKRKLPVEQDLSELPPEQGPFSLPLPLPLSLNSSYPSKQNPSRYENRRNPPSKETFQATKEKVGRLLRSPRQFRRRRSR